MANSRSMHASRKVCSYICSFIKNKSIDKAIGDLENVIKFKSAVPYKGEIPHRKGMMSGRYPIKASGMFIKLLKGLRGNASTNGLDLSKTIIFTASANLASCPPRRGGARAKRSHVSIVAKEAGGDS